MKKCILFFCCIINFRFSNAQCIDVYGINTECATKDDSLVVYNNALKVYDYYENNKSYQKTSTKDIITKSDKKELFNDLSEARRLFNIIRRELAKIKESEKKFIAGVVNDKYVDIVYSQYYQEIDEFRFYQRELENQIININAPISIYDIRISPIIVNTYKNIDTADVHFNDLVNIPLYVPVVVKPVAMLTEDELNERNSILKIEKKRNVIKREDVKLSVVKNEMKAITIPENYLPVYYYNEYGSGCIIGFFVNRKFRKLVPSEYEKFAVPNYARQLLQDNEKLNKYLKIKFGDYFIEIL
jgi:hypothetical protein